MNEMFWKLEMPGSETEIISIDLETGEKQSTQLELLLSDELAV